MKPTIPIEKGVPLPPPCPARGGRPTAYPWKDMEIGDSFLFPGKDKVGGYITQASRRYGRKFTARKVEGGCRIWRTG